jgi:hypothetical protein
MANSENEKNSHDSYPNVTKNPPRDDVANILDERRRAALAEVDNAKFSCVFSFEPFLSYCNLVTIPSDHIAGSM